MMKAGIHPALYQGHLAIDVMGTLQNADHVHSFLAPVYPSPHGFFQQGATMKIDLFLCILPGVFLWVLLLYVPTSS